MDGLTRAGYLAHYQSAAMQRRLAEAQQIIDEHRDYAVSVSWGKDSIAMLSVAVEVRPDIAVICGRYMHEAETLDDAAMVRNAILSMPRFSRVRYHEVPVPGEWQMFEAAGGAFTCADTPAQRKAERWWKESFTAAMAQAESDVGAAGAIIGMRSQESRGRSINIAMRGTAYTRADGSSVALPIARWTGADVWSRIAYDGLPYLRIYDMARSRERQRSDFTWAVGGGSRHLAYGEAQTWRQAYPQQFKAWLDHWPELRREIIV